MNLLELKIIGRIGKDAKVLDQNGVKSLNFSVAYSDSYKNAKGEKVEKTIWVSVFYKGSENLSKYLTKGREVYISGVPSFSIFKAADGARVDIALNAQTIKLGAEPKINGETQKETEAAKGTEEKKTEITEEWILEGDEYVNSVTGETKLKDENPF